MKVSSRHGWLLVPARPNTDDREAGGAVAAPFLRRRQDLGTRRHLKSGISATYVSSEPQVTGRSRKPSAATYDRRMQLVVLLLAAAVLLVIVGFIISALKWLLIIAAVLVAVSLLLGRGSRRSSPR